MRSSYRPISGSKLILCLLIPILLLGYQRSLGPFWRSILHYRQSPNAPISPSNFPLSPSRHPFIPSKHGQMYAVAQIPTWLPWLRAMPPQPTRSNPCPLFPRARQSVTPIHIHTGTHPQKDRPGTPLRFSYRCKPKHPSARSSARAPTTITITAPLGSWDPQRSHLVGQGAVAVHPMAMAHGPT
jgi:hypothetical protein